MNKMLSMFALVLISSGVMAAELPLPDELKEIPAEKIFQFKPAGGKFSAADSDASRNFARKRVYPANHQFGAKLSIAYLMPKNAVKWGKGPAVNFADFSPGKYRWVKWGENLVVDNSAVIINNDWGNALDIRNFESAVPEKGKKYTMYICLKVEGPAFSASSGKTENAIYIDRLIFVAK